MIKNRDHKCDTCGETLLKDNSPKTGDNSHIALWITLFFVSGDMLIITAVYSKKKKA